jgi:hypothetical protein
MLAMQQEAAMDDAGDGPIRRRRECPPFPWDSLAYILALGGDFSSDTTAKSVPMTTHRVFDGIRYAALEHARFGPVMTAIARAFNESRKRHGLVAKHFAVMMALEAGYVQRPDQRGLLRWVLWSSARPDAVVPDEEAARLFGLSVKTVRDYHREACVAVEEEWRYLHSRHEK